MTNMDNLSIMFMSVILNGHWYDTVGLCGSSPFFLVGYLAIQSASLSLVGPRIVYAGSISRQ